ncbi:hypothetical protein AAG906_024564 [Vitis piasezkii]
MSNGRFKPILVECQITTLVHLDLSSNDLNGSILDGFGNMISLAYLDLRYCAFEGEILFTFGDMRALEYLDISGHGLHGEIPDKFGNMTFLTYIALFPINFKKGFWTQLKTWLLLHILNSLSINLKLFPRHSAPLGCRSGIQNGCSFGIIPTFKRHHLRRHSCVRYRCYRRHSGIRFRRCSGDAQTPSHANKECHFGAVVGS